MTNHKPFLMGSETEYALAGRTPEGVMDADDVYGLLREALQRRRAWVEDHDGNLGLYLQHGGRLYLDYGSHPEHCTAECLTPTQVACHDKAGEHLLRLAADGAESERPGLRVTVVKNNLDPIDPDAVTYGTHESYTCWAPAEEAGPQLLAHLVSRVLYAGSGGLTAHAQGVGFELSQRARHLVQDIGSDTTSNRAIFCTRTRNPNDCSAEGWTRIHLIGKDSQRAPFGIYLTFATTGLLVEMLNRGGAVGKGLRLADPVNALRQISRDPGLRVKVPLADGRQMTALEIQSAYLEECERAVQHGGMPDWAPEAVGHWRQTLADLERDPRRLADRLDAYCKLLIYEHELLRADLDWPDLRAGLGKLAALRERFSDGTIRAVLSEDAAQLPTELLAEYDDALVQARKVGLERLRFAVRLQALDVNYHELGGLYDRLHSAGRVRDVVLEPGDVERASREPPAGGRAAVRGAWIREQREEADWRGDWQFLWHPPSGRCVDLRDPFSGELRVVPLGVEVNRNPYCFDILDELAAPPVPEGTAG
jgi:hypothetical protein